MKFYHPAFLITGSILTFAACSGTDRLADDIGDTGGAPAAGGAAPGAGGAAPGAGGAPVTTGGAPAAGGAAPGAGGAPVTTGGSDPGPSGGADPGGTGGEQAAGGSDPGTGGMDGSGGGGNVSLEGPCDIYKAAGQECVAAYSMIRRIYSEYTGPLYQVRSGSNAMNTGSGGQLHDIPQNADGFADKAAQDAVCANTTCTVSLLYDQSGRENHLPVAKAGLTNGGQYAGMDDFESIANKGALKVNGRDVYSLYMEARQGYRTTKPGNGMPIGSEAQGIYMLADGTRAGTACCWDFGNVTPNPKSYAEMNTLFLGVAYWGKGEGNGPWFGADFEAGVWMGGSKPGEPGWGGLDDAKNAPRNENNPSMRVKYALGFLKTGPNPDRYALRMADIATANSVHTGYAGAFPSTKHFDNKGAIVLGVGGDNSNNSWGTFYEGAIVRGFPSDDTENAVFQHLKSVGYGK